MTNREMRAMFASEAMKKLMECMNGPDDHLYTVAFIDLDDSDDDTRRLARDAVKIADAMMLELNKTNPHAARQIKHGKNN